MKYSSWMMAAAACLGLVGCPDDEQEPVADAGADVGGDMGQDGEADSAPDTIEDVPSDSGPDAVEDSGFPDVSTDAGGDTDAGEEPEPPSYGFESRFGEGSSVSYDGQVARHLLIVDLVTYIGGLSAQIDGGTFQPASTDEVMEALLFYYDFDSDANGEEAPLLSTTPALLQETYAEVSTAKNLTDKIAGNDDSTDWADWDGDCDDSDVGTTCDIAFRGWTDTDFDGAATNTPEALVMAWFEVIAENAVARAEGTVRRGPDGVQLPVYVTEDGLDLRELIQKFLTGAIAYAQGTDDYLDDADGEGKGLLADNAAQSGESPYTALEHAWDEAFGYYGASRYNDTLSDDEVADDVYRDSDGDGRIDLQSEYNFGHSGNAAKRDRGSNTGTDFSAQAFDAFVAGRALITEAGGALSEAQMTELRGYRDAAVLAWENAIASTVVHYVNDTIGDIDDLLGDTGEYSFTDHAKHWGELKGFALSLQFNPRSQLTMEEFEELHGLIGTRPVLDSDGDTALSEYRAALIEARDLLEEAYGYDSDDVENW
jgi:hypothetical protein